ncbi:YALI0C14410p [Yarrowia lipolytica CLIB122]|uniref:YALI0C14410p n=1 Tax=Yarrowia lipolytica (strain CLIB 122 / E 150) TaxID=284591 RepID=Q6CBY6_YARLI|nr:YALI0C14410p [Yarrowia lipolytica CLIB122]CAG82137.1 YALI0C14410p [Yarrowia lipolytica CLIB122]|eukprot:XP_501826.1 YALI0C14410p [Yarrowia lipolytica CLIB122]
MIRARYTSLRLAGAVKPRAGDRGRPLLGVTQMSQISSTAPPPESHKNQPSPLPFYDTHQEQSEAYSKRQRQPLFVATRNMGLFPLVDCERSLDQALKSKVFQQNWFAADYDADLVNAPTTLTITEAEIDRQRREKEAKKAAKKTANKAPDSSNTADTTKPTQSPQTPSKFKQLTALAKVALTVYKSGIKNVWINRSQAKQLLKKYAASNKTDITDAVLEHYFYNQVATHKCIFSTVTGELTLHKRDKEIARERDNNRRKIEVNILPPDGEALTRSEYQLILRTARDFPKLPLFVVVFCICFEFTPLVVLAFPQVLPGTCVIPSQARKMLEVRSKATRDLLKLKGETQPAHSTYHLNKDQLHAICKALKLTASMVPINWYPTSWLQTRVENHMKQVRADDILIAKSGGAWNMSLAELQQACLDRGIPVIAEDGTAYNVDWMRVNIFYWIVNYSRGRYDAGYLFADFEDLHPEEASQVMYLRDEYDWSLVNLKRP